MRRGRAIRVLSSLVVLATWFCPAGAAVPDQTRSYFTPQAGLNYSAPLEGADAIRYFRICPNNDGGASLPLNARIKIKLVDTNGAPMAVAAGDIFMLFNGGTPAQGFTGSGADSIIANFHFNQLANCPDVRATYADHDTDPSTGETFLTFTGVDGVRDPDRKWGGYEGDIPVFALGVQLQGRLVPSSSQGTFTLHIKDFDFKGGGTTATNQGELVNSLDVSPVQAAIGGPYVYNIDFDNDGAVCFPDWNMEIWHNNHKCNFPLAH